MHWIDYVITLVPFVAVVIVSWVTRRYMKSVADFMAASRCAGRYLVGTAAGEAAFGAVSAVALFEYLYKTGFVLSWWNTMGVPTTVLFTLIGFVIYRYRETRVLTLAQFFEIRYSKRFRIFAGIVCFVSGVLNYGIFPAVGARFFVNYCGLPQTFGLFGVTVPTFAVLMALFISTAMALTLLGGQLTIIVGVCLEGLLSGLLYLVVAGALLCLFKWTDIYAALATAPRGQSMLNPFDTAQVQDFNIWYVLIAIARGAYNYQNLQGGHAFRASAASPHEAKMGGILGVWRGYSRTVMITLLCICAITFMQHPKYAAGAAEVTAAVQKIPEKPIQTQMLVPVALGHMLPIGIRGAFACIMMFAMLACDGSYMHSWGSIFVQDVILPFRKKPFSPRQHIRILRWCIAGVGIYTFLFGLLFHQTQYILMFFAITGAIFLGGSGCAVLGGLYWKKGTTAAAWSGMIVGSILATGGIALQQAWGGLYPGLVAVFHSGGIHDYIARYPDKFPINGQVSAFIATCAACIVYVTVSLLTCREDFNMDRMLHRGQYAQQVGLAPSQPTEKRRFQWSSVIGFDAEFTLGDKIISGGLFAWSMFWFVVFVVGCAWYLLRPWPLSAWGTYFWWSGILLPFAIGVVIMIWLTWGGIRDLRRLFATLRTLERNDLDDGMVVNHRNLDEIAGSAAVAPAPQQALPTDAARKREDSDPVQPTTGAEP
jgi:solute:Na+ symporter, SSS family